jgi:toluene monooxygenase system protein E
MSEPRRKQKSFSMLGAKRRMPTEYELTSSKLHYHYPRNFELSNENPVSKWYFKHREESPLQAQDWELFADPRKTTYTDYAGVQDSKETVVDGLLREIDEREYDQTLSSEWTDFLHHWYGPLRYPAHGLQMLSAYVAQMAPASRITNCAAFQAADEMRRLQRIAYRSAQLHAHVSTVPPQEHQRFWQDAEGLQPLRELIERALVVYDFGEAFTVVNLVVKPYVDALINEELAGRLAALNGDTILREIHFSLHEDAQWHRAWSSELARTLIADTPANEVVMNEWIANWTPLAVRAVEGLASVFETAPVPMVASEVVDRIGLSAMKPSALVAAVG